MRETNKNVFLGRWRIVETAVWARDALDLVVPAHITFGSDGLGEMEFIAVGPGSMAPSCRARSSSTRETTRHSLRPRIRMGLRQSVGGEPSSTRQVLSR